MLRFTMILSLVLLIGCTPQPIANHEPLRQSIDAGEEVWRISIDGEDDIYHYIVLADREVSSVYTSYQGGDWESWADKGSLEGTKTEDGTIKFTHRKEGNVLSSRTENTIEPSGKFKQHWLASADGTNDRTDWHFGKATQISP